jgi:hypothetical protein
MVGPEGGAAFRENNGLAGPTAENRAIEIVAETPRVSNLFRPGSQVLA